jgi:hypothetical protein
VTDPIRPATTADIETIQRIAVDTEMFGPEDVGFFDEMVREALDGTRPDDRWLVVEDRDDVVGAAYCAPEPFADRLWNLYFQPPGTGDRRAPHGPRRGPPAG